MNKTNWFCLICLAIIVLAGVAFWGSKREVATPQGSVEANNSYRAYFGDPPVVQKGVGYARVGFYPVKRKKDMVSPIPLFLFKESGQLPLLLDRLVNSGLPFPEKSAYFNPFPSESTIRLVSQVGDLVELDLTFTTPPSPENIPAIVGALTETATQFDSVNKVLISVAGRPMSDMPDAGFSHDIGRIVPPDAPELLLVIASWETGAEDPQEILADFDRPVTVESFSLKDTSGQKIKGEYFTSAFNMAVVIRPENSTSIKEGMAVHADWAVVDRLGRKGQGSSVFKLERHDHADGH